MAIDNIYENNIVSTPYDDAFRTMMNDCIHLLIPVINEIFGKNYTGKERIITHPNEHFINQQDGAEQKRITDSSFTIVSGSHEDKYIFECQSTADDTLLIRIFEYITQEALDSGKVANYQLTVTIPNAAILFLRSSRNTPNSMNIVINTPGGSVNFDVPVIKIKSYSLAQIFEKDLYFLLPFYIFKLEKNFSKYESNPAELEKLKREYADFMTRLEQAVEDGKIFTHDRRTILEMSKKVLENIAAKYNNIEKEVKGIMGGRVLNYEGQSIFYEGIAQGRAEGRLQGHAEGRIQGHAEGRLQGHAEGRIQGHAEGRLQGHAEGRIQGRAEGRKEGKQEEKFDIARRLRDAGMTDKQIHQFTNLSLNDIRNL
ncbi:MAG: hypothetical protein IJR35_04455 [Synergistaceae bacterium]|nr:hypothetical protein [Synergistaceae bacterium]